MSTCIHCDSENVKEVGRVLIDSDKLLYKISFKCGKCKETYHLIYKLAQVD